MNKILVLGNSGAGKSSFTRELADILKYDYIHLDTIVYQQSWDQPHFKEMEEYIQVILKKDNWIIDGNFLNNAQERFGQCDTIFFLDINRFTCLFSALFRNYKYKGKYRESRNVNCDEKITKSYLKWIFVDFYKTSRIKIYDIINKNQDKQIIVFKNRKAIKKYLRGMK